MLPNSRMASVSGRIMKEMISNGITNSAITNGMPEGQNSLKKRRPFFRKPMTMTLTKVRTAKVAVTARLGSSA